MDYHHRQQACLDRLAALRLDAFLVTHLPNVRYLCGFTGSAAVLACSRGRWALFTDGRYTDQARAETVGARVVVGRQSIQTLLTKWLARQRPATIGFEAEHMTVAGRSVLGKLLPSRARLRPTSGLVAALRMRKEPEEVERIRQAILLGSRLFEVALKTVRPGVRESEVAAELEYAARRAGAQGMSFETIVAAGRHGARPHHRASPQPIPNTGFVILDFGVILAGYCSDMTRTLYVGRPSREARRMYGAVQQAQQAATAAVRPGVTAGEVDAAARQVLRRAGYGRYFTHSTGHGVGLEIHEPPRLGAGQREVLQPGMVVTIEPGIYIPGRGGVRIEDVVLVTEGGCEVLTPTTRELIAR